MKALGDGPMHVLWSRRASAPMGTRKHAGDAHTADARTARVKLSGASGNCVLKGAGREASVYP